MAISVDTAETRPIKGMSSVSRQFLVCKQRMAEGQHWDKPGSRSCFRCSAVCNLFLFIHSALGANQALLDQHQQSATSAVLARPPVHMQGPLGSQQY